MPVLENPAEPFGSLVARNGSPPPLDGASSNSDALITNATGGAHIIDRSGYDLFSAEPSGSEDHNDAQVTQTPSRESNDEGPRNLSQNKEAESGKSIEISSDMFESSISLPPRSSESHPATRSESQLSTSGSGNSRRATLDVDAFTRLILTGNPGTAPTETTQRNNQDENDRSQNQSSFEASQHTRSKSVESNTSSTTRPSTLGGKVPPPPPKPRHGRQVSHRVVSNGAQVPASSPLPRPTPSPRDKVEERISASTTTPYRRSNNTSPDASPNSSVLVLTPQESIDGSPRTKKPPTPPLARRTSHMRRSVSRTSNSSVTGTLTGTPESVDSKRSPASSQANTPPSFPISSKPLPVPPSPRNTSDFSTASTAHSGHDTSSVSMDSATEKQGDLQNGAHPIQALSATNINPQNAVHSPIHTSSSPQPPARTRNVSGQGLPQAEADLKSQADTRRPSPRPNRASVMSHAPPPPPPPRRAGLNNHMRSSSDTHNSQTLRKSSQSSNTPPPAANQNQTTPVTTEAATTSSNPSVSPSPGASHAANVLADLTRLQQEVDAYRGQYERKP